jgi:hypothetical protein
MTDVTFRVRQTTKRLGAPPHNHLILRTLKLTNVQQQTLRKVKQLCSTAKLTAVKKHLRKTIVKLSTGQGTQKEALGVVRRHFRCSGCVNLKGVGLTYEHVRHGFYQE